MAKLFRKIRLKLFSQNKISKYLAYALGEIFLVVIGILIALQINNWNNDRIQGKKEQEYLLEIKQNLERDSESINKAITFYKRKSALIEETFGLFELADSGELYVYQLLPKMDTLTSFEVFIPVRTAFDNMVASESIDLIQNKELRIKLSEYYSELEFQSGTQERSKEATRFFQDEISKKMMSKELIQIYLKKRVNYASITELDIHKDKEIASHLFTLFMNATYLTEELKKSKQEVGKLIQLIRMNLNDA